MFSACLFYDLIKLLFSLECGHLFVFSATTPRLKKTRVESDESEEKGIIG